MSQALVCPSLKAASQGKAIEIAAEQDCSPAYTSLET
jgi:hypothetical protein